MYNKKLFQVSEVVLQLAASHNTMVWFKLTFTLNEALLHYLRWNTMSLLNGCHDNLYSVNRTIASLCMAQNVYVVWPYQCVRHLSDNKVWY